MCEDLPTSAFSDGPPRSGPDDARCSSAAPASRSPRRPGRGRRTRRPPGAKRAYVLVVDGCNPRSSTSALTPDLTALRAGGMHYPRAWSMFVMETIPNHVMMMTGVRPDRSGVPANSIYDRGLGEVRTLDRPRDLRIDTVLQRMNRQGLTTGTVLSKEYLYGIFGARATHRWVAGTDRAGLGARPRPVHDGRRARDDRGARPEPRVREPRRRRPGRPQRPHRAHHAASGRRRRADHHRPAGRPVRLHAQATGRWRNRMVIVLADHSMDWSRPATVASGPSSRRTPCWPARSRSPRTVAPSCSTGWAGPQRDKAVDRMRRGVVGRRGAPRAARTHYFLRLGPEAGDVVLFCWPGGGSATPTRSATTRSPATTGTRPPGRSRSSSPAGTRACRAGARQSARPARTIDVAPTVAEFFGLAGPRAAMTA